MYNFTKNWFEACEFRNNFYKFIDKSKVNNILEIGCFEGQSTTFFSDNLLNNDNSFMVCVDPFYLSGTVKDITSLFIDNNTKKTFLNNIKKSKNYKKINFQNITSDLFFKNNKLTFNFIYIDGNHHPDYLQRDLENSFNVAEKNSIIWIDDYTYKREEYGFRQPKFIIDLFMKKYKEKIEILWKKNQVAIKKL